MSGRREQNLAELTDTAGVISAVEVDNDQLSRERIVARLRLLWEQRQFVGRLTGLSLVAALLIAILIPNRYESTTRLMPPDGQSSTGMALAAALAGKMSNGLAGLAGSALGLKSSGDLFVGILRSRTVQDELITKYDLRTEYGFQNWDRTRQRLSERTAISEDRKSGIITISVTDRNRKRAAAMAQEYVTELNSVVTQLNTSSAHRERVFLEERLAEVKRDLEKAETEFGEFASKSGAIDIKEQGRAMVGAAATLQGELIATQSELEGLKQIYSDNNVRVRSLRARVAELRSQLQQMGGKEDIVADATSRKDDFLYPSIRKLPLLGVSYADLYRRTKIQEAVFETLTQEYELAKVAEAKEIPSVKVLDPADVPERKSFPPRLFITLLGGFLGLCAGVAWLIAQDSWAEIDPQAPHKILVGDVVRTVNASMPWASTNGSRFRAAKNFFSRRIVQPNSSGEGRN